MNKVNVTIWGRSFSLKVIYDCYGNEAVTPKQKQAIKKFLAIIATERKALEKTKQYCLAANPEGFADNMVDNIFRYVMPQYLYVRRSKKENFVAIMCDYRFNMEQGLAVVFKDEVFSEVVSQNAVLQRAFQNRHIIPHNPILDRRQTKLVWYCIIKGDCGV